MAAAPLWIDTDLALGARKGDVDDGWAVATVVTISGSPAALAPASDRMRGGRGASHAVFASHVKKRVFTLDVACALAVGTRDLRRIARASELGRHLVRASLRWLAYAS